MNSDSVFYSKLLGDIKTRIQTAQVRTMLSVNAELVRLYWDIGQLIDLRQNQQGWGAAIIPNLSRDLHNELPEIKGVSERNIKRMLAFYRAYCNPDEFVPQPVAQISETSLPSIEEIKVELGVENGGIRNEF